MSSIGDSTPLSAARCVDTGATSVSERDCSSRAVLQYWCQLIQMIMLLDLPQVMDPLRYPWLKFNSNQVQRSALGGTSTREIHCCFRKNCKVLV
jgi:hypothetical protein